VAELVDASGNLGEVAEEQTEVLECSVGLPSCKQATTTEVDEREVFQKLSLLSLSSASPQTARLKLLSPLLNRSDSPTTALLVS
jgi:hypothetical protein